MRRTDLSPGQISQSVFDPTTDSLRVEPISGQIVTEQYDYIAVTYPTTSQEVYTFHTGGVGGPIVATVTVNYTDSTKENLLNVSKV